jgi:hypothetical protein
MIATSYDLPFSLLHSPQPFSRGDAVEISVRARQASDVPPLKGVFAEFSTLAATGALAGSLIEPSRATFKVRAVDSGRADELRYEVASARIADEAVIVLAHMLLGAQATWPVDSVRIFAPARPTMDPLAMRTGKATYPGSYPNLPFTLDDQQPEGGGASFYVQLERDVEPVREQQLNAGLAAWVRVVLRGGFALHPLAPTDSYVEPNEDTVTSYDNRIEWALIKLRADWASVDALINLFASFSGRCQKITHLEIG